MSATVFAADPIELLARKLKSGFKNELPASVAVLDFPYSKGRFSSGSYLVSERLVTYLTQQDVPLVERRLLPKIYEERKLSETGIMDEAAIKKMNGLLGADAVVVGTLSDISDSTTQVMARVIRVDTAKILSAATCLIVRLWPDLPHIPRFAAPLAPMPGVYAPLATSDEKSTSRRHTLSNADSARRQQPYRPAPVPYFMPSSAHQTIGGSPQ